MQRRTRERGGLAGSGSPARDSGDYIDRWRWSPWRAGSLAARRWADDAVAATTGLHLSAALSTRARAAIAQGEPEPAGRDAHEALATAVSTRHTGARRSRCLAALAVAPATRQAARLSAPQTPSGGAAALVRFKIFDAFFEFPVAALRDPR